MIYSKTFENWTKIRMGFGPTVDYRLTHSRFLGCPLGSRPQDTGDTDSPYSSSTNDDEEADAEAGQPGSQVGRQGGRAATQEGRAAVQGGRAGGQPCTETGQLGMWTGQLGREATTQ